MKTPTIINNIQNNIHTIRGVQVMFDRDLADLYEVSTKRLNEQVKRNIGRFPKEFRFQITEDEKIEVVANCDHLESLKFSPFLPYVFTEQGVAMLASVLKSQIAMKISVQIMQAFVHMRRFLIENANIFNRLDDIDRRQLSHQLEADHKFNKLFKALDARSLKPKQGIFYDGQIFDAYVFIIYTKNLTPSLKLDLKKFNSQYENISIQEFKDSHDRFLIIDHKELYNISASLKGLGKKWFAFSRMDGLVKEILGKI